MSEYNVTKQFILMDSNSIKLKAEYKGKNRVLLIAPEAALAFATKNNYSAVIVRYGTADINFLLTYIFCLPCLSKQFLKALYESFTS
jgi:hypothetical protein